MTNKKIFLFAPPNLTGTLHIGHALIYVIQSITQNIFLAFGHDSTTLIGFDHGGIMTQLLYKSKDVKIPIEEWVLKFKNNIGSQLLKMNFAQNLGETYVTNNPELQKNALNIYNEALRQNMVLEKDSIVAFDTTLETAISDIEFVSKEVKRYMYSIKYFFTEGGEYITIKTTKPETIFGDRIIVTNLYEYVGRYVINPFTKNKIEICYYENVDISLGNFIKITPCCDKTDWIIYNQIKNDPIIPIYDSENYLLKEYRDIIQANKLKAWDLKYRELSVNYLNTSGFIIDQEERISSIPVSTRTGLPIWNKIEKCVFLKFSKRQKDLAISLLKEMNIKPRKYLKIMEDMIHNFDEWCISRTISWGQKIPNSNFVFDTWFNSCNIPHYYFNKFGMGIDTCYTGQDIVFFWIVRMMLMYTIKQEGPCFKNLFFSGLITDNKGQKISKSKGNVVEPEGLVDKYGIRVFRILMLRLLSVSDHTKLNEEKINQSYKIDKKLLSIEKCINKLTTIGTFYLHLILLDMYKESRNNSPEQYYHLLEKHILNLSKTIIPKCEELKFVGKGHKAENRLLFSILKAIIYGNNTIPRGIYNRSLKRFKPFLLTHREYSKKAIKIILK